MNRIHSIPVALAAVLVFAAPADAKKRQPKSNPPDTTSVPAATTPTPEPAPTPAPSPGGDNPAAAAPATPTTAPGSAVPATSGATIVPPATEPAPASGASVATVTQSPPAQTESPLRSLMLGVRFGATVPQPFNKLDANFLAEVEGAYQLPVLEKRLGIFLDIGYSQPTRSDTLNDPRVPGGTVTYDETVRDLGFTLGAHYWHPITSKFLMYGGAGARLHLTHTLINAASSGQAYGENTEDSTRVGVMLRLGAGYVLGPGALVLEIHFEYTGIDHLITGGERGDAFTDPVTGQVRPGESANTANLGFQLGYQFFLL